MKSLETYLDVSSDVWCASFLGEKHPDLKIWDIYLSVEGYFICIKDKEISFSFEELELSWVVQNEFRLKHT